MPDTAPTPKAKAPPPEDGWRPDLLALRGRLDELDDKIHDLLIDRLENDLRSVGGVALAW